MFRTLLLCTLSALVSSVAAAPALEKRGFYRTDFTFANLTVDYVENGTSTLDFTLAHSTTLTNFTGPCTATWTNSQPSGTRIICGWAESFIEYWNGPDDFGFEIKQSYHDPSVGQPDIVTVWGHGHVNQSQVACFSCGDAVGSTTCKEPSAAILVAPITSMIAKR